MADLTLFWSYAHSDDKGDRGRVTLLATHLADEVRVLSGMELDVFVDRKSIEWGDQWRSKIDGALAASTFLVAVLSPTYFRRPECRKEFVTFYSEAESRGLDKLLLPLSYVEVGSFDDSNPDEAIAIAAKYQYEDWTTLRLKHPDSEEYREGVNGLAKRLLALHGAMEERQRAKLDEIAADPTIPQYDFFEALAEVEKRLPAWQDAVESEDVRRAQYRATDDVYNAKLRSAPQAQRLALRHRYATDELKLISESIKVSRLYSALSIELTPFVVAAIRGAAVSPEGREALRPLYEAVTLAHSQLSQPIPEGAIAATEFWSEWESLGGVFRQLIDAHREGEAYREEGNVLVEEWYQQLTALFDSARSGDA